MAEQKRSLNPFLLLGVSLIIVTLWELVLHFLERPISLKLSACIEASAFLVPAVIFTILSVIKDRPLRVRLGMFSLKKLPMVVYTSFTVTTLSFLLNYLTVYILKESGINVTAAGENGNYAMPVSTMILYLAAVPALCEELLLRSACLGSFQNRYGIGSAVFLSGLCFSMLHMSPKNFVGPFVAGIIYACLTYTLNSVWPAVIAHFLNNSYSVIINRLMERFPDFIFWPNFLAINLICFLFFLFLTLRNFEHQLRAKPLINRSKKEYDSLLKAVLSKSFAFFLIAFLLGSAVRIFII